MENKKPDDNAQTLEEQERDLAVGLINAEHLMFAPNAQIEVKEVMDSFSLITYDLPATKEGNRARHKLLMMARLVGAIQYTESVYLAPFSRLIDVGVLQAAEFGKVIVWISTPQDTNKLKEITIAYDSKILEVFKETEERLAKITKHIEDGQFGLANKMLTKTESQINNLVKVAVARGSQILYDKWSTMKTQFDACSALLAYKLKGDVSQMVTAIANNPDIKAEFEAAPVS